MRSRRWNAVARNAVEMDLGGFQCRVLALEDLIRCKRALGRPKDLSAVSQLEKVQQKVEK